MLEFGSNEVYRKNLSAASLPKYVFEVLPL